MIFWVLLNLLENASAFPLTCKKQGHIQTPDSVSRPVGRGPCQFGFQHLCIPLAGLSTQQVGVSLAFSLATHRSHTGHTQDLDFPFSFVPSECLYNWFGFGFISSAVVKYPK